MAARDTVLAEDGDGAPGRPPAAAPAPLTPTEAARFDVFLSHNSREKPTVERLAEKLKRAGLEPWLDKWCLSPGGAWQDELAEGLRACASCAVFVGPSGLGDWSREEFSLALDRAAKDRTFRLFLVLLPGLPEPFDAGTLPPYLSTRTWVDLRRGTEDRRGLQVLIHAIKGIPLGPERPIAPRDDVCPYRGLQPFDERHAEFFFGRDGEIARLVEKLKATHFLAVLGPSGSGKSSVVRAGLIPALRRGALPGSEDWQIRVLTPGAHPLEALAAQIEGLGTSQGMQQTLDLLTTDERTLHLGVALALADRPAVERVVWVIDQFEEVFTLCRGEAERAAFLANLLYAAAIPDGRCTVVITMRADFYPRCAAYAELSARVAAQQFLVSPMAADGLQQAIEEPARRVGLEFEQGLVDTILDNVAQQPGALPLLEHALLELWERRRGGMLTLEGYRESGGVQGAIAQRAETIWAGFTAEQQVLARRILLRLTQPGEGTEDTRRRAAWSELVSAGNERRATEAVVRVLADARLLTTSADEQSGDSWVEVTHEALIRNWPRFRQWLDEDRAGLRVHRRLTAAAQEWALNRDDSSLYRGTRLAEALEWQEHDDAALNETERAFLAASAGLQEQERRTRDLQRRRQVAALGIGLVAALLLAGVAGLQWYRAEEQREAAVSRELAASAQVQLPIDPELGLLLATEAATVASTDQAEDTLLAALLSTRARAVMRGHEAPVSRAAYSSDGQRVVTAGVDGTARVWEAGAGQVVAVLRGHTNRVLDASFSPDGQRVATASRDGTGRLWEASTGRSLGLLLGHTGPLSRVAFGPNGQRVLTASADHTARVWDASTGAQLVVLQGHTQRVLDASFSPDGQRVLTAGSDDTARVWDATTGAALAVLRGHTSEVRSAVFSPDGRAVLTVSTDRTARLWDASTGAEQAVLRGHADELYAGVFSPDGRLAATVSADDTARLWDLRDGTERAALRGHVEGLTSAVTSIAFSPDGRTVLTGSSDRTARQWDARTGKEQAVLRGHTEALTSVTFSPDGESVLTASEDATARVWQARPGRAPLELDGHGSDVLRSVFSPDGSRVLTASRDGTARLWDAASGASLAVLRGHAAGVWTAVFSPDGRRVLTGSGDGTARVWDVSSGRPLVELRGHSGDVLHAVFSPDGQRIATASADGTAAVWDAGSGFLVAALQAPMGYVADVAFSPNGRRVATASADHMVRVWEAGTGKPLAVAVGHTRLVNQVRFSPSGEFLLSASDDGTARLWHAATGTEAMLFRGGTGATTSAAFSRNGRFAITASDDGTARVWKLSTGRVLAELRGHTGTVVQATFSPDGKRAATASTDDTARVYSCEFCGSPEQALALARARATRQLTADERARYLPESSEGDR